MAVNDTPSETLFSYLSKVPRMLLEHPSRHIFEEMISDDIATYRYKLEFICRSDYFRELLVYLSLSEELKDSVDTRKMVYLQVAAAKVFLRMFLAESAYEVCKSISQHIDSNVFFTSQEIVEFRRLFAFACYRSGRSGEGQRIMRSLLLEGDFDVDVVSQYIDLEFNDDTETCKSLIRYLLNSHKIVSSSMAIRFISYLIGQGEMLEFLVWTKENPKIRDDPEFWILKMIAALNFGDENYWLESINALYRSFGLSEIATVPVGASKLGQIKNQHRTFDKFSADVSVIMTAFNAENTIVYAIQSVLAQSFTNFELIIVDDASVDDTCKIINSISRSDPRIRLIKNRKNAGTYACKNLAIEESAGQYITFHDSDDWMHPERLKSHWQMRNSFDMTVSKWIRVDSHGAPTIRRGDSFLHVNPASTFFNREIIGQIGTFDSFRVGSDTEFLSRVKLVRGNSRIKILELPLGLGLQHSESLTTSGITAFNQHRFSSIRSRYAESWNIWHFNCAVVGHSPYMLRQGALPFPAPFETRDPPLNV